MAAFLSLPATRMEQFLLIAAAHFLALLSPGPDFFLIARTSLSAGWRMAGGACVGIALANGVFIVAAFAGLSVLRAGSPWFTGIQLAGAAYLLYLGVLFMRHAGHSRLDVSAAGAAGAVARGHGAWWRAAGMGFVSAALNPKNALFYASLAAMLAGPQATPGWKVFYGAWMFCAVLLWDLAVAVAIGNRAVLRRFARALTWLERVSGAVLVLAGCLVLAMLARAG